jgi:hypothetical protein
VANRAQRSPSSGQDPNSDPAEEPEKLIGFRAFLLDRTARAL